ncbi:uncharacterized protein LOC134243240 isoform X1 [Saccostrea cucullata]|uniref:uncharacterized protein LOC134243240 isoform X1 n=1 Tax=Saccostrea cuccullata TaxID=36930 RepID=UPI002ECFFDBC
MNCRVSFLPVAFSSLWTVNSLVKVSSMPCPYDQILDNKKNICKACESGYFGVNCSLTCRFPSFGDDCQQQCYCTQQYCHPSKGCISTESGTSLAQTYSSNIFLGTIVFLLTLLVVFHAIYIGSTMLYRRSVQQRERKPCSTQHHRYEETVSCHFGDSMPYQNAAMNSHYANSRT